MDKSFTELGIPTHQELVLPVLRAVKELGESAKSKEIVEEVLATYPNADALMEYTYENRPEVPVLKDRIEWSRSTAKRVGGLEQPGTGVYLLTDTGRQLLAVDKAEALKTIKQADYEAWKKRRENKLANENVETDSDAEAVVTESAEQENLSDTESSTSDWKQQLLSRLHALSPDGFEKFVIYLLKRYDLRLTQTKIGADEGIDAIGMAPLSPVLSSRVAVQVKRYDPVGKAVGRETVALFQRDAQTQGAERAILVTLSRFTEQARKAATAATPTVDLIDGDKLAELILDDGQSGVTLQPDVDLEWFNRFD